MACSDASSQRLGWASILWHDRIRHPRGTAWRLTEHFRDQPPTPETRTFAQASPTPSTGPKPANRPLNTPAPPSAHPTEEPTGGPKSRPPNRRSHDAEVRLWRTRWTAPLSERCPFSSARVANSFPHSRSLGFARKIEYPRESKGARMGRAIAAPGA